MSDRRLTPANGRVAHVSLRGRVEGVRLVAGDLARITAPLTDLLREPGGARERQLLRGDSFRVLDRDRGHAFGQAAKDGYCGWVAEGALGPDGPVTHRVVAPASHAYPEPRIQSPETCALPFGALLEVRAMGERFAETCAGFVPKAHLRALDDPLRDPVATARLMLGTPYLWGGNSRAGIDCSGLVQGAHLACAIPCPGDSDLQAAAANPPEGTAEDPAPGDLLFWKGHVGIVSAPGMLLHATAAFMTTLEEPLGPARLRIAAAGGGPVTSVGRLAPRGVPQGRTA